jgi:hypothetical protein
MTEWPAAVTGPFLFSNAFPVADWSGCVSV